MSTIVTRAGKGSALTHNEVDANFTNLNTDKIQSGNTVAELTITNATINGGTITGITDLSVADGGTGRSLLTANNVLLGNNSSAVNFVAPGASGNVLTSNGTTWTSEAASQEFPSGTLMLFQQTAAPTGWTKQTTHNNKALRVVSGTASSGGTVDFTTAFDSKSVSGTIGSTTLTTSQIPSHSHLNGFPSVLANDFYGKGATGLGAKTTIQQGSSTTANSVNTQSIGGGSSHDHTFTGSSIDLAVQYVDLIIASKD